MDPEVKSFWITRTIYQLPGTNLEFQYQQGQTHFTMREENAVNEDDEGHYIRNFTGLDFAKAMHATLADIIRQMETGETHE